MPHVLIPHASSESTAVRSLDVTISHHDLNVLKVQYRVNGALEDLFWPAAQQPVRTDELWRHTCLELFLRAPNHPAYCEFNFSPSLEWAAYHFDAYREGMKPLEGMAPPQIETGSGTRGHEVIASVTLNINALDPGSKWRLGISAIIEETSGKKSYWALAHPPGKPDFHHSDCFALELGAQEQI